MPDGRIGYTRNGAFSRNSEGLLTTSSGYVVQPEIQIPLESTQINISSDGIVSVQRDLTRRNSNHTVKHGDFCLWKGVNNHIILEGCL